MTDDAATNLMALLSQRAAENPTAIGFRFVKQRDELRISYRRLYRDVQIIATRLLATRRQSPTVLLALPHGYEFVAGLLGCLYAGRIAVPAYPLRRNARARKAILRIIEDCDARTMMICDAGSQSAEFQNMAPATEVLAVDRLLAGPVPTDQPAVAPVQNEIAYLQYTSGSTGNPKGVMVTHANLIESCRCIDSWSNMSPSDVSFSWLPIFHDMGLVFHVIYPLFASIQSILLAPMTFLQRPLIWLEMMSRYRATFSGAPNFAFDYCLRRAQVEDLSRLDLSSWRLAYAAAEPNRPATLSAFVDTFKECGFRPAAIKTAYGLAENTLLATGVSYNQSLKTRCWSTEALETGVARLVKGDETATELVTCGRAVAGQEVRIVDPKDSRPCPDRVVGEIWLRSGSVTAGYWKDRKKTAEVFVGRLHSNPDGEDYLRTGDLGFLDEGELYLVGRIKDLIIVHGRNHYPQDIEQSSEQAHSACVANAAAAFGIGHARQPGESVVVVQEIDRATAHKLRRSPALGVQISRCIRARVYEEHGLKVLHVALLAPFRLPKTRSGKVMRQETKRLFQAGELMVEWTSVKHQPREAERLEGREALPGGRMLASSSESV